MDNNCAIAVMVKAPVPGSVKTRLCPPLTPSDAAGLYRCFVEDTFVNLSVVNGVDVHAACAMPGAEGGIGWFSNAVLRRFPQEGAGLGARMQNVFKRLFAEGYAKVCVIGSDSPDLPMEYVEDAFRYLDGGQRLVLGPATDGGYYLIAMNEPLETPFRAISWSTALVLSETISNAATDALPITLLRRWHDMDGPADLIHLKDNPKTLASTAFIRERGLWRLIEAAGK
ncbi:MAG: TIGR04282 family arsenosugar biosynthesis glycosyltransferase [Deltaproteobacteria bacterium]|nr:TIGR04282 family arsenosugar biosynthesis glycosyltransferase [Deltaproteobacteria bacterium]